MQIYFHSRLCSYLSRVPILVEGTVYIYIYIYIAYLYIISQICQKYRDINFCPYRPALVGLTLWQALTVHSQDNSSVWLFFQYVCRWRMMCIYDATAAWICALLSRTTAAVISLPLRGRLEDGLSKTFISMKRKSPDVWLDRNAWGKMIKTALLKYLVTRAGEWMAQMRTFEMTWWRDFSYFFFFTAAYTCMVLARMGLFI